MLVLVSIGSLRGHKCWRALACSMHQTGHHIGLGRGWLLPLVPLTQMHKPISCCRPPHGNHPGTPYCHTKHCSRCCLCHLRKTEGGGRERGDAGCSSSPLPSKATHAVAGTSEQGKERVTRVRPCLPQQTHMPVAAADYTWTQSQSLVLDADFPCVWMPHHHK